MRSLNDIIVGNQQWESFEARLRKRRDSEIPWQKLRAVWGSSPTNVELMKFWDSADAETRRFFNEN